VLGILIGVAAVVIVVALGTGVRKRVMGEISSLGANTIYVFPEATQSSGARSKDSARLTEEDAAALVGAPSVEGRRALQRHRRAGRRGATTPTGRRR
jgi:ABC-type lipoprotein release transport system permease subunit